MSILRSDLCRTLYGSDSKGALARFKSPRGSRFEGYLTECQCQNTKMLAPVQNLKIFHQNPNVILPFNSLREHKEDDR